MNLLELQNKTNSELNGKLIFGGTKKEDLF